MSVTVRTRHVIAVDGVAVEQMEEKEFPEADNFGTDPSGMLFVLKPPSSLTTVEGGKVEEADDEPKAIAVYGPSQWHSLIIN